MNHYTEYCSAANASPEIPARAAQSNPTKGPELLFVSAGKKLNGAQNLGKCLCAEADAGHVHNCEKIADLRD